MEKRLGSEYLRADRAFHTPAAPIPRLEFAGLNEHAEGNPSFGMLFCVKIVSIPPLRRPRL